MSAVISPMNCINAYVTCLKFDLQYFEALKRGSNTQAGDFHDDKQAYIADNADLLSNVSQLTWEEYQNMSSTLDFITSVIVDATRNRRVGFYQNPNGYIFALEYGGH